MLAILMPVVPSMGGIAGSQTLILITRGIALGQVESSNVRWLLRKELGVGSVPLGKPGQIRIDMGGAMNRNAPAAKPVQKASADVSGTKYWKSDLND